jgi:glucokinase
MKEVVAGIDIGGTNTVIGLIDRSGTVVERSSISTINHPEINDFIDAVDKLIKNLAKKTGTQLMGIGIGAPNGNFHKGTIELAPNLVWKGVVPVADIMTAKAGVPVKLTNDANAAALGEMMFGGARGMKDFVVFTLGTGLGSGIVCGGEVLYGKTGLAGEYGHVIMFPDGRDCGCGRSGCLETYVSATGLVRTVLWLISEMRDESPLRKLSPLELTSKKIAEAAMDGDKIALQAFDYTAEVLALAIVNYVSIASPEAIFLFGGLANAGKLLFDPVNSYIEDLVQPVFRGTFKVVPSAIEESNAAITGAAALAWNYI